jgi:hypothetical protein
MTPSPITKHKRKHSKPRNKWDTFKHSGKKKEGKGKVVPVLN